MVFNPRQCLEIYNVYDNMSRIGLYLGGSRSKLGNMDAASGTDWDWNAPDWGDMSWEQIRYLNANFYDVYTTTDKRPAYADDLFVGYLKHRKYPHITVVLRRDLDLYRKVFGGIPLDFWAEYLWKSNPNKSPPYQTYITDIFNTLFKIESLRSDKNFYDDIPWAF